MPNQRKKGKKFVGAWLPEKLYDDLQRIAKVRGVPVSTIVDDLLTAHVGGNVSELKHEPSSESPRLKAAKDAAVEVAEEVFGKGRRTKHKK